MARLLACTRSAIPKVIENVAVLCLPFESGSVLLELACISYSPPGLDTGFTASITVPVDRVDLARRLERREEDVARALSDLWALGFLMEERGGAYVYNPGLARIAAESLWANWLDRDGGPG